MRIFVTGGTGYIGSAVVRHLVRAGHSVTGLSRTPEARARLQSWGAEGALGRLETPSTYGPLAAEHDAAVHLGYATGEEVGAADRTAVDTLLAAAEGKSKLAGVVYTSGVLALGPAGQTAAYEDASTARAIFNTWRPANERLVLAANSPMLATAVIRPGWVYGGKGGLAADYFETALADGAAVYIGDGHNRMPVVQRDDIAELYRLLLEQRASGIFHGVEEPPARIIDYATAASRAAGKGGAVRSLPLAEAKKTIGTLAEMMCLDQWVGSRRAQALGWKPRGSFVENAAQTFAEWSAPA
jgi:nucleoside-diphosphate-sugar epimerase